MIERHRGQKLYKNREKRVLFLLLSILVFCAGCANKEPSVSTSQRSEGVSSDLVVLASVQEPAEEPHPGEEIMRALSAAHPGRIGPVEFRNGDWAFQVRGRWFYYAEGRILPEELRGRTAEYRALGFNRNYPVDLPSWESTAEQRAARTRSYEENRARQAQPQPQQPQAPRPTIRRPNYFFEALWNSPTRERSSAQQAQVDFLGRRITVHSDISQKMSRINQIIMNEARTNPTVRQWVNSLGSIAGWNWRNVASSGNRSFHSYGIAIDILPADLRGQATYWLWTSQHTPQWWNIPYSGRWHPPEVVIKTFESFGFIWGGKWANFDTMHFEYRPEIFVLSGIPMANFPL